MSTPAIDPATRAAVLAEECARLGHIHVFTNLLFSSENGGSTDTIGAQDPTQMPHFDCRRCGRVWIVIETTGSSYADAISEVGKALTDLSLITPIPRPQAPDISLLPVPGSLVKPPPLPAPTS